MTDCYGKAVAEDEFSIDFQDGSDYDKELEDIEMAKTDEDIANNHVRAIAVVGAGKGRLPITWIGD